MLKQKCPILHIFAAQLKLQPNLVKEIQYALVAHANFQKNSCGRINNKKRNHALPVGHFKHITNNPVSPAKYSNILSIKFTNNQVFKIIISCIIQHYDQCTTVHLIAVNAFV